MYYLGGTYCLPYVSCATKEQFSQAYPGFEKLIEIKKQYDPEAKFRNMLWERYVE